MGNPPTNNLKREDEDVITYLNRRGMELDEGDLIRISIDVPRPILEYKKKHGLFWRQILKEGVLFGEGTPMLKDRIAHSERNISYLQKKITELSTRIYELEGTDHAALSPTKPIY